MFFMDPSTNFFILTLQPCKQNQAAILSKNITVYEKCPNTDFFLSRIFPCSVRKCGKTYQKNFSRCVFKSKNEDAKRMSQVASRQRH